VTDGVACPYGNCPFESDIKDIKKSVHELEKKTTELGTIMKEMKEDMREVKSKVRDLTDSLHDVDTSVVTLKQQVNNLHKHEEHESGWVKYSLGVLKDIAILAIVVAIGFKTMLP